MNHQAKRERREDIYAKLYGLSSHLNHKYDKSKKM